MIDVLGDRALDRLFVQAGGGALASACAQGFADAVRLGRVERLPRLHAVQTRGGFPLARAYDRLARAIAGRLDLPVSINDEPPARADALLARAGDPAVDEMLGEAATHRSAYMWPWETEPRSIAQSILDDETYDWLAVCEAMIRTGGHPIVVDEDMLMRANAVARETTGIDVDHTGSAGLAALMHVVASGADLGNETIALLFTGVRR
jgi:threonine synthase